MPRGDGTGPDWGGGPGSGRGRGMGRGGGGRGMGRGMGRGGGGGRGRMFGGGVQPAGPSMEPGYPQQPVSEEQELEILREQAGALQARMNMILNRIDELNRNEKPRGTNPSSKALVNTGRCTGCGVCESVCREKAITVGDVAEINLEKCTGCGLCVEECPNGAISLG